MKSKIQIFDTKDELARQFGNFLIALCKQQEIVNIALSGGNTPKAIFDLLSIEFKHIIEWHKIRLFWVDERCVEPTHPDSNYGMTRIHLLDNVSIPYENVFRIPAELEPEKAVLHYSECLKSNLPQKNNLPYFNLTILGMGDDGHTASIFPDEMYLWNSHNLCEVAPHPQTGQKRITLTGSIINNSSQIVFLVTGKNKAMISNEILTKTGGYMSYPASLVRQKRATWFMDAEAASLISN